MKRLAIFVSGNGTNMANLITEIQAGRIPGIEVAVVISDNSRAGAIERARKAGVEVVVIERKKYSSKAGFEAAIIDELEKRKVNLIALAGFTRILSPDFVRRYHGRIINIHPSLLPSFSGANAIKDAFKAGVSETGVTVHLVDEGVDTGPIILQEKVLVQPGETLESLEAKIHAAEYLLYPEAIRRIFSGRTKIDKK